MRKAVVTVAMMAAVLAAPAVGQQGLRDVAGSVTDGHEPLRGAVVYCENDATQQVVTYVTDRSGRFQFHRLGGDTDYHVWAMFRGAESKKRFLSKFDSKKTVEMRLEVKLH